MNDLLKRLVDGTLEAILSRDQRIDIVASLTEGVGIRATARRIPSLRRITQVKRVTPALVVGTTVAAAAAIRSGGTAMPCP